MIYKKKLSLTAGTPERLDIRNLESARTHYIQIDDSSTVTIRATLESNGQVVELDTVTGPGLFSIPAVVCQFEMESDSNTSIVVCG